MSTENNSRQGEPDFRPNDAFYESLPTFSTGTNSTSFVRRPGLDICLNIIFSGRCNTAVKTEPDMNPEEFIEGALHATSEVTRALANGDLDSLQELMTPECLAGAKANLKNLTEMQRGGLQVLKEDAMVSWIGKSMKNNNTGESRLLLGVTSLPAKSWIINNRACAKEKFKEDTDKLLERGRHNPEYLEREMKSWKENFEREHGSLPKSSAMDFVVTNVEFTRRDSNTSWRISSVSTKSGRNLNLDPLSSFKWRFRMAASLRPGIPFMSLLRYDLATDLLIIVLMLSLLIK